MKLQRTTSLLFLGAAACLTAGCALTPPAKHLDDGRYCRLAERSNRPAAACTSRPIPGDNQQAEARQLLGAPGLYTVYVIRDRWNDAEGLLTVSAPGHPGIEIVPQSFIRLRLPPGTHRLQLDGADAAGVLEVRGQAGEVGLVEVEGEVWSWRRHLHLTPLAPTGQRDRVARLPLVASAE